MSTVAQLIGNSFYFEAMNMAKKPPSKPSKPFADFGKALKAIIGSSGGVSKQEWIAKVMANADASDVKEFQKLMPRFR